mmetsp:Transcript_9713/g.30129  ORF Transcript_9713/g.30129 Transcript_9713/m.30129 type:complete len:90 (+) Transcript_9713:89-358(+)
MFIFHRLNESLFVLHGRFTSFELDRARKRMTRSSKPLCGWIIAAVHLGLRCVHRASVVAILKLAAVVLQYFKQYFTQWLRFFTQACRFA